METTQAKIEKSNSEVFESNGIDDIVDSEIEFEVEVSPEPVLRRSL